MSVTRLEVDLLKVKKDLKNVKKVNEDFCKILNEINNIKEKSFLDSKLKEKISEEFKQKEIIDIFASVESDFQDLKKQLFKQELFKEKISDFVESLRTRKTFSFTDTTKTILFVEEVISVLNSDLIVLKPQFVGTMDLGEIAIKLGLHKNGSSIIVQKELFSEVLALLVSNRLFRNLIFETNNAKMFLKASNEITIESDNLNIRKISRIL